MRKNYSSGARWEDVVGYSRAVQVGNQLEVTGTVSVDAAGKTVGIDNVYEQTRFILEKIGGVMKQADFMWEHVVRTRIYMTDISQWEAVGQAHREVFASVKPATTIVQVAALISPEYLVEIEVSAVKA